MECSFRENYSVLLISGDATNQELRSAFEIIYAQYIDDSGLYQSAEFEKYGYIDSLEKRITTVDRFIYLQTEFIKQFQVPFIPGFEMIAKFGHKLFYNVDSPDIELFLSKLETIRLKEQKYKIELKKRVDELMKMREKKVKNELNLLQSRKQFISMITRLRQQHHVIEYKTTMVEELSIMVRDAMEEKESAKAAKQFKTR